MKITLPTGETFDLPVESGEYVSDIIVVARVEKLEDRGKDFVITAHSPNVGSVMAVGMLQLALDQHALPLDD